MRSRLLFAVVLALVLSLSLVAMAGAATPSFQKVSTAGAVAFPHEGAVASATFSAGATGPAAPGEGHQPARGTLLFAGPGGSKFKASVEHIHAHAPGEVHFGGTITWSNDPALVGKFAHCVAIDGGPGADEFSVLVTETGVHEHGAPLPVLSGNLVVRTPGM